MSDSELLQSHNIENMANEIAELKGTMRKNQREEKRKTIYWVIGMVAFTIFISTISGLSVRAYYKDLLHAENLRYVNTQHESNVKGNQVGRLEQGRSLSEQNLKIKDDEVMSLTADLDKANKEFKETLSKKDAKIESSRITVEGLKEQLRKLKIEHNKTKEELEKTKLGRRAELKESRDKVQDLQVSNKFMKVAKAEKESKIKELEKSVKILEGEKSDQYREHKKQWDKTFGAKMSKELKDAKDESERRIGELESALGKRNNVLKKLRRDGIVDENFAYPIPEKESVVLRSSLKAMLISLAYLVVFGFYFH